MFRFRTIIALLVLLAVVGAVSAYRAARTVPEFYQQVLELPPQQAEAAGEEFMEKYGVATHCAAKHSNDLPNG